MAKKKAKRNKAYNPKKRLKLLAQSALRGQAIIFVGSAGDSACNMVDMRTKEIYAPSKEIAQVVENGRYKWAIYCAVFCRDQLGKNYMQGTSVVSNDEYRQSDLAEFVESVHTDIVRNQVNRLHVCNVGWLAAPMDGDIDETKAGDIFAKTNAWDYLTKAEQSEQKKQE